MPVAIKTALAGSVLPSGSRRSFYVLSSQTLELVRFLFVRSRTWSAKWHRSRAGHEAPRSAMQAITEPVPWACCACADRKFIGQRNGNHHQPPRGLLSCSMMSSTLKLDGFWRGGNSAKVPMNFATSAWVGTARKA
jgi:hypothetical protein